MNANPHAPARPDLCARAPGFEIGFAARFAVIVAGLVALIARAFLRNPSLAPLIVPLCRRLTRTARRLPGLMSQIAAGPLP